MDASKKRSVRGRRNIEKGRKGRREFDGPPEVNFSQLHMNTLKRYKRFYDIKADTQRKEEYTEVVSKHFQEQQVDEMETIILFSEICMQKRQKFNQNLGGK